LGGKLFECRDNHDLRFISQDRGAELFVSFLGNYDEIRALLAEAVMVDYLVGKSLRSWRKS
jgi:hypothetical protein